MAEARGHKTLHRCVCLLGVALVAPAYARAEVPDKPTPRPTPAGVSPGPRLEAPRPAPPRPSPSTAKGADKNSTPEQKLDRAKLAYQRGDYGAIVLLLRPLLYPETLLAQEEQVLLAHKLLALSYYFEHDEGGAEQEFNLLLSLRPDFALDPVVDPLQAVAFLDDIRRRNSERLEEIRRRQAEEEQRRRVESEQLQRQAEALAQQRTRRIYIERVVHRRFSAVDLLPFGVPQLVAKRKTVGSLLLVGEVLAGAASLATWITVRYRYPNGMYPAREYQTQQALTGTYLGTGALFWGLVLTGLIDALVHSRTITEIRELNGPPPELRRDSAPGDTAPGDSAPQPRTSSLHFGIDLLAPALAAAPRATELSFSLGGTF